MDSDPELLRRYCEQGDQQAFTEFVRRHLDLVYSAAAHQARSRADADELAQQVFVAAARKARALSQREDVVGWLFSAARFAAQDKIRSEMRRGARERTYVAGEPVSTEPEAARDAAEPALREFLLESLTVLKPIDRSALLLRYWENRSWEQVGRELSLSADGARKRGERALELIRVRLGRRGISSGGAALAAALSESLIAAPYGAAAGIAATAAAAGLSASTFAGGGFFALMAASKTVVSVVALATLATTGMAIYEWADARHSAEALDRATRQAVAARDSLSQVKLRAHELHRRALESRAAAARPPAKIPAGEVMRRQQTAEAIRSDPKVVAMAAEEQRRYLLNVYRRFIVAQHLSAGQAEVLVDVLSSRTPANAVGVSLSSGEAPGIDSDQRIENALGIQGAEALAEFETTVIPADYLVNKTLSELLTIDPTMGPQTEAIATALEKVYVNPPSGGDADFGARMAEILDAATPQIEALLTQDQRVAFKLTYTAITGREMPRP